MIVPGLRFDDGHQGQRLHQLAALVQHRLWVCADGRAQGQHSLRPCCSRHVVPGAHPFCRGPANPLQPRHKQQKQTPQPGPSFSPHTIKQPIPVPLSRTTANSWPSRVGSMAEQHVTPTMGTVLSSCFLACSAPAPGGDRDRGISGSRPQGAVWLQSPRSSRLALAGAKHTAPTCLQTHKLLLDPSGLYGVCAAPQHVFELGHARGFRAAAVFACVCSFKGEKGGGDRGGGPRCHSMGRDGQALHVRQSIARPGPRAGAWLPAGGLHPAGRALHAGCRAAGGSPFSSASRPSENPCTRLPVTLQVCHHGGFWRHARAGWRSRRRPEGNG